MDTSDQDLLSKFHDTCIELFKIVGHDEQEAEANYTQLMGTANQLAISQLITTLPKEKQDQLLKELQASETVEEAFPLVTAHFSPEQFSEALNQAFNQVTQLYFGQISDTLTPEQRNQITSLLLSSIKT